MSEISHTPPADAVARLIAHLTEAVGKMPNDSITHLTCGEARLLLAAYADAVAERNAQVDVTSGLQVALADAARDREAMFTFGWDRAMTNVRLRQENPRHFWSFRDELADAMAKALAARTGEAR